MQARVCTLCSYKNVQKDRVIIIIFFLGGGGLACSGSLVDCGWWF